MTDDSTLKANITPFGLRMQPELKARVDDAAKRNNRSMNAEIVARLEESLTDRRTDEISTDDLLDIALAADQIDQSVRTLIKNDAHLEDFRRSNLFKGLARLATIAQRVRQAIWRREYDASPTLQAEFLSREDYSAYQLHYGAKNAFGMAWRKEKPATALEDLKSRVGASVAKKLRGAKGGGDTEK